MPPIRETWTLRVSLMEAVVSEGMYIVKTTALDKGVVSSLLLMAEINTGG